MEKVIIDGEEKNIYPTIPNEEIEDNSDLMDLEDTLDLSGVIENE